MMARKKPVNPFYVLLVVVGAAFAVTACAYGVTAMRALRPSRTAADAPPQSSSLTEFMDEHGEQLLVGELLLLAVATVGAISTDGYWMRRGPTSTTAEELTEPPEENQR
jgi:hypothetical protein